jgi:hypothetical protein
MELNIQELDFENDGQDFYEDNYEYNPENKVIKNVRVEENKPNPYDAILSKMGMFVANGKLHMLEDRNIQGQKQQPRQIRRQIHQQPQQPQQHYPQQNNYIYNKYFKEELQPEQNISIPKTKEEYKRMLLEQLIQRERIKKMKSTKLIMPTTNINISGGRNPVHLASLQNKLFTFPKR